MDADTSDLLFYIGLVLVMVLFWTYYILEVRRNPRSEEWYDESAWEGKESDGVLFYYPYCSLMLGAGGVLGLVESMNPPEFVDSVLRVVFLTAVFIGAVGMTGGFGVPLPWPFVPGGSSTFAKRNVLEGASVGKLGRGKGRIGLATFLGSGCRILDN